mmetsp:Transcript_32138/g.81784  ORF Transcript_32138/g.81784 Transcript_32138/m.81784 type:complete len:171 (-) Transcript_32138:82-594(-)
MASERGGAPWIYCKNEPPAYDHRTNQGLSPHMGKTLAGNSYRMRSVHYNSKSVSTAIGNDPKEFRPPPKRSMSAGALTAAILARPTPPVDYGNRITEVPSRFRQFHRTGSHVSMRITESPLDMPGTKTYSMWMHPGNGKPALPFKDRHRDAPVATQIFSTGDVSRPFSAM